MLLDCWVHQLTANSKCLMVPSVEEKKRSEANVSKCGFCLETENIYLQDSDL